MGSSSTGLQIRDLYFIFFLVTVFAVVSGIVAHVLAGFQVSSTSLRALVSALLTAQAAVIAIVFSLTMLSIQIAAPKYSARLAWLFTRSPAFKQTTGIFALSLGANAFTLLFVTQVPPEGRPALAFGCLALAAGTLAGTYLYTRRSAGQMSPDGIIRMHEDVIDPDFYRLRVKRMDDSMLDRHPMRGLYEMIVTGIRKDDDTIAGGGAETYNNIVTNVAEDVVTQSEESMRLTNQVVSKQSDKPSNMFQQVVTNHLPKIITKSRELDGNSEVCRKQAMEALKNLTIIGMKRQSKELAPSCFDGYRKAIKLADSDEELVQITKSVFDLMEEKSFVKSRDLAIETLDDYCKYVEDHEHEDTYEEIVYHFITTVTTVYNNGVSTSDPAMSIREFVEGREPTKDISEYSDEELQVEFKHSCFSAVSRLSTAVLKTDDEYVCKYLMRRLRAVVVAVYDQGRMAHRIAISQLYLEVGLIAVITQNISRRDWIGRTDDELLNESNEDELQLLRNSMNEIINSIDTESRRRQGQIIDREVCDLSNHQSYIRETKDQFRKFEERVNNDSD